MKYLLLIFLTTGMDVERCDSLKDCRFAAEAFTACYCGDWGYFKQRKNVEKPIDVFKPDAQWFVCGKIGMSSRVPTMTQRAFDLSGSNRWHLYEYRASCFQSTK